MLDQMAGMRGLAEYKVAIGGWQVGSEPLSQSKAWAQLGEVQELGFP